MTKHKVAVYGTLRPKDEQGNVQEATHYVAGFEMFNYYNRFPYVVKTADETAVVKVNIMEVDDKGLDYLDRYEGLDDGMYTREQVEVCSIEDGEPMQEMVWMYVAGNIAPERIPSGDWTKRDRE